jgi:hypothetical protein
MVSWRSAGPDQYERTSEALLRSDDSGRSVREILEQELKPGDRIAGTNAQAAGYILQRPALSLIGPPNTSMTWTESELRRELARFNVDYLLMFNESFESASSDLPFLRELVAGRSPEWLQPVAFRSDVKVYRVQSGRIE